MAPRERRRWWKRLLLAGAAVIVGVAGVLFLLRGSIERAMLYQPHGPPTATPADRGLAYADVTLTTSDGVTLHGWHVRAAAPRALVVHLHGNAGNIQNRLPVAAALAAVNLDTLLLDYRGYGKSTGRPSEDGLGRDADAAFAWAAARGLPVVLYGESLGGAVAIDCASRHAPAALVVQGTFTSLAEMADRVLPFGHLLATERYASAEKLPAIRAPLLVVHGEQDEIAPLAMGQRLYEIARGSKELFVVPGAHHNDLIARAAPEVARRVAALLARW